MTRAIVIAAAMAWSANMADAAIMLFDNSNREFTWVASLGPSTPNALLDPTRAPGEQSSAVLTRSLQYSAHPGGSSTFVGADGVLCQASIRIARELTPIIVSGPQPGQETSFRAATAFTAGQQVGVGANFENFGATGYFNPSLGRHNFLGEQAFIGFRVMLDGQPHFGWIELVYGEGMFADGGGLTMYQPLRWAYETEPNTPITVPSAPGAALLLGAAAAACSRRRRDA